MPNRQLTEKSFLAAHISKYGMQPDPSKTEKVRNFPRPTDPTTVRQFVGLASYYRRFVPGFAKIAAPLHRLTKKKVTFEWSAECEDAYCQLKKLLTEARVDLSEVWVTIQEMDHEIRHRSGRSNASADALSRKRSYDRRSRCCSRS